MFLSEVNRRRATAGLPAQPVSEHSGTLIVRDVGISDRDQQQRLIEWLDFARPDARR